MNTTQTYEVIIIGGSYAGLSAAMTLGRSLRQVLIIDSQSPCNRQTPKSHNFITQDGIPPEQIAQTAREQVLRYPTVSILNDQVNNVENTGTGFQVKTAGNNLLSAHKLIFATGIKDLLPDIPGIHDCWGISVIHCPYCHGYEFAHKRTGILANGERAMHLSGLVSNLTSNLTLFTNGPAELDISQREKLKQNKIQIIENKLISIAHLNGKINKVYPENLPAVSLDALYAAVPFRQHSEIPEKLGCKLTESGHLQVDSFQKTTIPGIYACGDNASLFRSVSNAVYTGNIAGASINMEFVQENF